MPPLRIHTSADWPVYQRSGKIGPDRVLRAAFREFAIDSARRPGVILAL
jgi:hypothetical protein